MLAVMTETQFQRPEMSESLSGRVARRLRGCLAENRISQTDLARAMHMPQQKISRKVIGHTPLTLDEIELLAQVLDIEVDALMGVGTWADRPIGLVVIGAGSVGTLNAERPAAPGGGQAFLPLGEGCFGAPSGTRTPNPLIPSEVASGNVVPLRRSARSSVPAARGTSPVRTVTPRPRHLSVVRQEAS